MNRLRFKYRFIILDDKSFEEKTSVRLSMLNIFLAGSTLAVLLIAITSVFITATPLKYLVLGGNDRATRKELLRLNAYADSIEYSLAENNLQRKSIQQILLGKVDTFAKSKGPTSIQDKGKINLDSLLPEDQDLRAEMANMGKFSLTEAEDMDVRPRVSSLSKLHFFTPVKGFVTDSFAPSKSHMGIDIAAPANEPIKATLDGTVIMNSWTLETGYVIGIQHSGGLVSFYKHNSVILKNVGTFVKAGDAIAIIGNSGEQSSGPHLHFELWLNGNPVNPYEYIHF